MSFGSSPFSLKTFTSARAFYTHTHTNLHAHTDMIEMRSHSKELAPTLGVQSFLQPSLIGLYLSAAGPLTEGERERQVVWEVAVIPHSYMS